MRAVRYLATGKMQKFSNDWWFYINELNEFVIIGFLFFSLWFMISFRCFSLKKISLRQLSLQCFFIS